MFTVKDIEIVRPQKQGDQTLIRAVSRDGARKRNIELWTDDPLAVFAKIEGYLAEKGSDKLHDAFMALSVDSNALDEYEL